VSASTAALTRVAFADLFLRFSGHFEVSSRSSGDKFTVTQGQLLVLTRRLKTTSERDALIARGHVFAEPGAVARVFSHAFAVPTDRVFDFFRDVYRFGRFGHAKPLDRGRLYGGVLIVQVSCQLARRRSS
jgi:hypothetical protein